MSKWEDLDAEVQNDVLKALSVHILSIRRRIDRMREGGAKYALEAELDRTTRARNAFERDE